LLGQDPARVAGFCFSGHPLSGIASDRVYAVTGETFADANA